MGILMPKDESGISPSIPSECMYVTLTMLSPDSNDTMVSHCSSVKKPLDWRCTAVELPGK